MSCPNVPIGRFYNVNKSCQVIVGNPPIAQGFLPCQMWVLIHSNVTVGLVPTWSYISVECHSLNGGTWSVTRNTQPRAEGHSDVIEGCVPTWSDISAEVHSLNGGTWSITRNPQPRAESHSNVIVELVPTLSDISAEPFWCDCGIGSYIIKCKCRAL